jgi:hypothetical protein
VSKSTAALDEASAAVAIVDATYGNWDLAPRTFDAMDNLTVQVGGRSDRAARQYQKRMS